MYQFLLTIEQGHVQLLSNADSVLNKFIDELSGKIRNPPPVKAQVSVQQRNLYLQQLLKVFIEFKKNFIKDLQDECEKKFVNEEAKQASLHDLMNRYNAELIRIKAEFNSL